jgi:hypothetical protein
MYFVVIYYTFGSIYSGPVDMIPRVFHLFSVYSTYISLTSSLFLGKLWLLECYSYDNSVYFTFSPFPSHIHRAL